jgi:nucleotide-binding universal stress UspA family protein
MFQRILVPVDGSEQSDAAVALALRMASEDKGELIFVHAVELNRIAALAGPAPLDPSMAIDAACRVGNELLDATKAKADAAGVRCTTELPEDECVGSVLELARQKKADLIVVGSHGRSGISRALLGSVAEGILRRSPVPVLVCHAPKPAAPRSSAVKATAKAAEQTII